MKDKKAYIALAVVSVVWGTTYPAMRVGASTFSPLLFAGIRHFTAGLALLLILLFLKRKITLEVRDIIRQAIPGVLMFALSNGTINWAEKYIPAGLTALILSIMPVYVVLINLFFSPSSKDGINWKTFLGLLLGTTGVVLIFRDNVGDLGSWHCLLGILAVFGACLCWTLGTLYIKSHRGKADPLVNIVIQMSSGGIVLLNCSLFWGEMGQLGSVSPASLWALAYLVIFGSLVTYLCYVYAVKHLPVGLVSVYAYINPFVV